MSTSETPEKNQGTRQMKGADAARNGGGEAKIDTRIPKALQELDHPENNKADNGFDAAAFFDVHPSTLRIKGQVPNRVTYAKFPENLTTMGKFRSGGKIADGLVASWDGDPNKISYKGGEHAFEFNFANKLRGLFTLTWSLTAFDLDLLDETRILSMGFTDVQLENSSLSAHRYYGRLVAARGGKTYFLACDGREYCGRFQVSFHPASLKIPFDRVMQLSMEFMVDRPGPGTLSLHDPMIWVQDIARM